MNSHAAKATSDFESDASASSATSAYNKIQTQNNLHFNERILYKSYALEQNNFNYLLLFKFNNWLIVTNSKFFFFASAITISTA